MTDIIVTITITDADSYVDKERAAEDIMDRMSEVFEGLPAPMTAHMLVEDRFEGRPLAERRIVGWDE